MSKTLTKLIFIGYYENFIYFVICEFIIMLVWLVYLINLVINIFIINNEGIGYETYEILSSRAATRYDAI